MRRGCVRAHRRCGVPVCCCELRVRVTQSLVKGNRWDIRFYAAGVDAKFAVLQL